MNQPSNQKSITLKREDAKKRFDAVMDRIAPFLPKRDIQIPQESGKWKASRMKQGSRFVRFMLDK